MVSGRASLAALSLTAKLKRSRKRPRKRVRPKSRTSLRRSPQRPLSSCHFRTQQVSSRRKRTRAARRRPRLLFESQATRRSLPQTCRVQSKNGKRRSPNGGVICKSLAFSSTGMRRCSRSAQPAQHQSSRASNRRLTFSKSPTRSETRAGMLSDVSQLSIS